ncbi:MAG: 4-phosphoerythronate dehydrogenase [Candidatus Kapaibacteriota bacterium]
MRNGLQKTTTAMDILIDEHIPFLAESLQKIEEQGFHLKRFQGRTLTRDALDNCIALCVRSTTRVNAALLQGSPVRFVGTATSGLEHIDADFLREAGILFRDARGCNANSVAEYVVFSLLLWAEKSGLMTEKQPLRGKTLGLIGYGHIGKRVAALALNLGMRVLVNDPPLLESGGLLGRWVQNTSLDSLLSEANVVTNHVPYTTQTKHTTAGMIDEKALVQLREKTLFIHASRGGIVAESALLNLLEERDITAVVDVWQDEPRISPTLAKHCLLATPHIAGYSFEGKIHGSMIMARELERFASNILGKSLMIDWSVFEYALAQENHIVIDFADHHLLLEQLRVSRNLESDTALLRASLNEHDPSEAFDRLRKTYPQRREIIR